MINKQIFTRTDKLKEFKETSQSRYPNCAFFEHNTNATINVVAGYHRGEEITETIITDGTLSLQKRSIETPLVIWENHLLTLENGISVTVEIKKSSFMVDIVKKERESQCNIHVQEEDENLLKKILAFLYENHIGYFDTNSIRFSSPTILTLESIINGKRKQEIFNFQEGSTQKRKSRKRGF